MVMFRIGLTSQSSIQTIQLGLVCSRHQTSIRGSSFPVGGVVIGNGDLNRSTITFGQRDLMIIDLSIRNVARQIFTILVTKSLINNAGSSGHNVLKLGIVIEEDTSSTSSGKDDITRSILQLTNKILSHKNYPPFVLEILIWNWKMMICLNK